MYSTGGGGVGGSGGRGRGAQVTDTMSPGEQSLPSPSGATRYIANYIPCLLFLPPSQRF
jgi:hypothetical protein